jgi:hypothetical protein
MRSGGRWAKIRPCRMGKAEVFPRSAGQRDGVLNFDRPSHAVCKSVSNGLGRYVLDRYLASCGPMVKSRNEQVLSGDCDPDVTIVGS